MKENVIHVSGTFLPKIQGKKRQKKKLGKNLNQILQNKFLKKKSKSIFNMQWLFLTVYSKPRNKAYTRILYCSF